MTSVFNMTANSCYMLHTANNILTVNSFQADDPNVNHNLILSSLMTYHWVSHTTDATSRTTYPSRGTEFTTVFSEVCVARSLVFCAMFCRSLFVLFLSSIYGFWLHLWFLQNFLIYNDFYLSCHVLKCYVNSQNMFMTCKKTIPQLSG